MAPPPTISELVSLLKLQPHPEGGFYTETFRDTSIGLPLEALPTGCELPSPIPPLPSLPAATTHSCSSPPLADKASHGAVSTAIYFLVPSRNLSKLHRIPQAEVWHFYLGDPLTVRKGPPVGPPRPTTSHRFRLSEFGIHPLTFSPLPLIFS